jgi:hypothetical protein
VRCVVAQIAQALIQLHRQRGFTLAIALEAQRFNFLTARQHTALSASLARRTRRKCRPTQ